VEYVVDAAARRVGKKVNGVLQQGWLYESGIRIAAQVDATGAVTQRYVYGTQSHSPDVVLTQGKVYRLVKDHLGSIRLVVDSVSGEVKQRIDYDAWGRITSDTSPGFQPFGYAGGLLDNDTGLTRFGARDYDAEAGRWTAKDPLGFAAGDSNVFVYVGNEPINMIDPTGLYDQWDFGLDALEFAAGLGNAVTFGASSWIAEQIVGGADARQIANSRQCSNAFKAGEWAGLVLGSGRLAYAGITKGASLLYLSRGATLANAARAVAFRNGMKALFRLNPWTTYRIKTLGDMLAKKGSVEAVIRVSGSTSAKWNGLGAAGAFGGAAIQIERAENED
jgi:RHS repeat-associated protein